jgi:hypothetical protein
VLLAQNLNLIRKKAKCICKAWLKKSKNLKSKSKIIVVMPNKSLKHRHFVAGQFLSRSFVVLLRKSAPQNRNLKTAA